MVPFHVSSIISLKFTYKIYNFSNFITTSKFILHPRYLITRIPLLYFGEPQLSQTKKLIIIKMTSFHIIQNINLDHLRFHQRSSIDNRRMPYANLPPDYSYNPSQQW